MSEWYMVDGDYPYLSDVPKALTPLFTGTCPLSTLHQIDGDYPYYGDGLVKLSKPYPVTVMVQPKDNYPEISGLEMFNFSSPYPFNIMTQADNSYPNFEYLVKINMGAFMHTTNLLKVKIPESMKSIGEYGFSESIINKINLPLLCTYYNTSFSKDCEVTGGELVE